MSCAWCLIGDCGTSKSLNFISFFTQRSFDDSKISLIIKFICTPVVNESGDNLENTDFNNEVVRLDRLDS